MNAPTGWTVAIDSSGNVTVTPMPGVQGGTFPIQIIAQSTTDANLEAQTTIDVTIMATQPGLALTVTPDTEFTVPFDGAQLPTTFRVAVANLGPATDTYNLTFSTPPSGFTYQQKRHKRHGAGRPDGHRRRLLLIPTGEVPAVGTQVSFQITATSTTTASITQTQTETFTVPAIDAVTLTGSAATLSTAPGVAASETITLAERMVNEPATVSGVDAVGFRNRL